VTEQPPAGRPDTRGDGDGWTECGLGHRHWGLFGAAGLLLARRGPVGLEVLLQHRATWSHHGGTWGLLGGARHRSEGAVEAALREAGEEGGLDRADVRVHGRFEDPHGGWSYETVVATAAPGTVARPTGGESIDVGWFAVDGPGGVDGLDQHPGFGSTWPQVREALQPLTVVVDVATVMGSRPDGWWRDRPGAARRLVDEVAPLAAAGVPDADLPDDLPRAALAHWWPRLVAVVEGAARPVADDAVPGVELVAAWASGDDAVVSAAAAATSSGGPCLVVTADRELRDRVASAGAVPVGPGWLLGVAGG
jgi:8-oxo-dGTP pyrophosphatase MutT (NUDIX family)